MKKEITRVSINKFEKALDESNVITDILWDTEDVEIQVIKTISLSEMMGFIRDVVDACIDMESGEYIPESYDFAIRVAVLTHFANFGMPSSLDKQYSLIYGTRAFEQVVSIINKQQFSDIVSAIDKKIKFRLDIISSSAFMKINDVIDKFNEIGEMAEGAFGEMSGNEISEFIEGLSKLKELNQNNVVDTITNFKAEE